jgi:glycosyltransferase involved in cell wall biosynthesis
VPIADWELVVVDNASRDPVEKALHGHDPACRVILQAEGGLTAARIRGIEEARGDLIVFVDDDNLPDRDYLEQAVRIAEEYPRIGAFGGRISGEFADRTPEWMRPFLSHVAVIDVSRDQWTNNAADHGLIPCGAGLCIRRQAAVAYADAARADPRRLALDRSGSSMMSCGDTDMVLSCVDAGWGMGRFTALHLTHVIPASRLVYGYQKQLAAHIGYSYGRLLTIRGEASRGRRAIALGKTLLAFFGIKHRGKSRKLDLAYHYGVWKGLR